MKIFVIIVTYNGQKWIRRCLDSLRASTIPVKVIIVDNASNDLTLDIVENEYSEVYLLREYTNKGFGQANNIGIRYALNNQADYIVLLNQDAYVYPDMIQKVLCFSDGRSLLSPIHLNGSGAKLDAMFKKSLINSKNFLLDDLLIKKEKNVYDVGEVCAACWILPRSIIEKIGGFNPLFFHYGEDNNYYHRLIFHGISIKIIVDAFMLHDREMHGNIKVYNSKWVYRRMLLIFLNINLSSCSVCKKLLILFRDCYASISKKMYIPGVFIYYLIVCCLKYRSFYLSRKKEKKTGLNWL